MHPVVLVCVYLFFFSFVSALKCNTNTPIVSVSASTYQDGNPPEQAIDGNFGTRWSAKGLGVFLTSDLGSSKTVCSVSVAWLLSTTRVNYYIISVSNDGSQFTQVASGTSSIGPETLQTYTFTETTARFVRLTVNGNSAGLWASVLEFKLTSPGFEHPGILVSQSQINNVRAQLAANAPLAVAALNAAKASAVGQLSYTPSPTVQLRCGSGSYQGSHPNDPDNNACFAARMDGLAAYTQALIWVYGGGSAYAASAINILNRWSSTMTNIKFTLDPQFSNGPLQAGWMMEFYPRAAEILKHATDANGARSGWAAADSARFGTWIVNVFLPLTANGWPGYSNWDFTTIAGTMNIGIFTDNQTAFNVAISKWKSDLPRNFYIKSDGATPIGYPKTVWYTANTFFDGITMETCRDAYHVQFTLASVMNVAETSRIQGADDLYSFHQNRILPAFEFNAWLINYHNNNVPSYICGGTVNYKGGILATWDIFYNHYKNRMNINLPNTTALMNTRLRPSGKYYEADPHMMAWEVLTHGNTFNA